MEFECTQCGLCCKHLHRALDKAKNPEWMHVAIDLFPHAMNMDGSCEKLVDNKCSVYDNRPLMCNISDASEQMNMPISKKAWYEMNYAGCKLLLEEDLQTRFG